MKADQSARHCGKEPDTSGVNPNRNKKKPQEAPALFDNVFNMNKNKKNKSACLLLLASSEALSAWKVVVCSAANAMVEKRVRLAMVRRKMESTVRISLVILMPSLATVMRRWAARARVPVEEGGEVEAEEELRKQRPGRRHQSRGQLPKGRPKQSGGRFALCFARPKFCFSLNKRGALIATEIWNACAGTLQLQARERNKSSRTWRSL